MQPAIHLNRNDKIVFAGDSITDADRHHPAYAPLGRGYVHFAANTLLATYPQLNLSIINTGVGGDTILDLQRRWEADCLSYKSDVLSVLIGINDAWYLTTPSRGNGKAAPPEQYEVTYDQLLLKARSRCDCQIVLIEPFVFSADRQNQLLSTAKPYITIVRELAAKHGAVLVALQEQIDKLIAQVPSERWADDAVHPRQWAHAWIAQRWLQAAGL
ncbi:MAG: SGNH/GDSL hydrolase family protein [Phycisphaerales bacterium]|nr:MAG: SGNH/GDSL hydrolase family protein [Phycisphaerales bacterium]